MNEIDELFFRHIVDHLSSTKQPMNQIFGIEHKPGSHPDLSKRSIADPKLYHLLMKFAIGNLPFDFTYSSIQLIKDIGKLDKHNKGPSFIVRFGNYTEGDFVLKTPYDTQYNIRHRPMIFDPSKTEYYFKESEGGSWTLVYYTLSSKHIYKSLREYEPICNDGKWLIAMYRTGQETLYLNKKNGLPLHLSKKKESEKWSFAGSKKPEKPEGPVDDVRFSAAQNLMMRSGKDQRPPPDP
tara:strand:- start:21 stop:734 length:714 start_codon:yes stop_codon:yes gene_type:complete